MSGYREMTTTAGLPVSVVVRVFDAMPEADKCAFGEMAAAWESLVRDGLPYDVRDMAWDVAESSGAVSADALRDVFAGMVAARRANA